MNVTYFKRFKMEIDLAAAPPVPALPDGYFWIAWDEGLLETHAAVKYASFYDEIDSAIFPSLADRHGCSHLMREIRNKPGFVSQATWMIACGEDYCGTVQGVRDRSGMGAIQNLGVVSLHRGKGLGTALLIRALEGFRHAGLKRVYLEVTAQNEAAIRLYRRTGFRCRRTIYKAIGTHAARKSLALSALS